MGNTWSCSGDNWRARFPTSKSGSHALNYTRLAEGILFFFFKPPETRCFSLKEGLCLLASGAISHPRRNTTTSSAAAAAAQVNIVSWPITRPTSAAAVTAAGPAPCPSPCCSSGCSLWVALLCSGGCGSTSRGAAVEAEEETTTSARATR